MRPSPAPSGSASPDRSTTTSDAAAPGFDALVHHLSDVTRGRRGDLVGLTLGVPDPVERWRAALGTQLAAAGYPALSLRLVPGAETLVLIAAEFVRSAPPAGGV